MSAPTITLTTDFGHKGPFVGIMKGVILKRLPDARIIDLTHEVHAHWPAEGGFWLSHSHEYFPAGTVHVAVVDPGVGTGRAIVATEYKNQLFLAPDNGILSDVICNDPDTPVYQLSDNMIEKLNPGSISSTFHGRDIFAPLATELAAGKLNVSDIGPQHHELVPSLVEQPEKIGARLQGTVVAVDSFGNLISNISKSALAGFNKPVISCGGKELSLQDTYGRSQPGELLALINSFGMLEIARAEGDAAEFLGLGLGAPIKVASKA